MTKARIAEEKKRKKKKKEEKENKKKKKQDVEDSKGQNDGEVYIFFIIKELITGDISLGELNQSASNQEEAVDGGSD